MIPELTTIYYIGNTEQTIDKEKEKTQEKELTYSPINS